MRFTPLALACSLILGSAGSVSTSLVTAGTAHAASSVSQPPYRVLDTRSGSKPAAGSVLTVLTGHAGASAVGVNITITDNDLPGFVTAWSGAGAMPTASVINTDAPGQTRANYVVVPVQADGTFRLYTQRPAHLVVDVLGGFDAACANAPSAPSRVLDTRSGPAPAGGSVLTVRTGRTGATAVGVNITVTENDLAGFVTAWSGAGAMPTASIVNTDAPAETRANYAVVALRPDGTFSLFTQQRAHLVVDVLGTFAPSCAAPLASPVRVLDTRSGPVAAGGSAVTVSTGLVGATSVGVNITITETTGPGFATAWSGDGAMPTASVLNADGPGQTLANYVVVPVRPDGTFRIFSQRPAHLVVDVMGAVTYTHAGTGPGRFLTVPPGAPLPSDAECAARVRRGGGEVRPANATFNQTAGRPTAPEPPYLDTFARVTGALTGTTDEIIQWTACKWGIDEDVVRAQVAKESYWFQRNLGDFGSDASRCLPGHPIGADGRPGLCPESVGLMQVRYPYFVDNIQPSIASSAYNLDISYAAWRACYEGRATWLNTVERGRAYSAGDLWGCVGEWFSGRWFTQPANEYIAAVQGLLAQRIWETPGFLGFTG